MNSDQAAFELGCAAHHDHWGCKHRSPAEYAHQVNWNRRYLKPGDGDKLILLREIRDSWPYGPSHLHAMTPPDCPICVPRFPLSYPAGFSTGPGLYTAFKKTLCRLGYSKGPEGDYQ